MAAVDLTGTRLGRFRGVVATAAWFALAAGILRAVHYATFRVLTSDMLWRGNDTVWMAPLAHLVVFAVPAIPLGLLAAVAPRFMSERVTVGFFATWAVFSPLLLFPRVHYLAAFLLAVGAGIQISSVTMRNRARIRRMALLSGLVMLAGTIGSAAAMQAMERATERRATASLQAPPAAAPNVLLLILDTVRAASMHLYGYSFPNTPSIEALGAEGVVFDQAMATSSWTLPTHATLLTGKYPTELDADWLVALDDTTPMLSELLRARGYVTGAFMANPHYTTRENGLARGFVRYRDYQRTFTELLMSAPLLQSDLARDLRIAVRERSASGLFTAVLRFRWSSSDRYQAHPRKSADVVVDEFLTWRERQGTRPWFAMLNFFDAHAPYKPGPEFREKFQTPGHGGYEGAIATIDQELGRLFDSLRMGGQLDRTLVIVTSDHGELFGEHGLHEHGAHLYQPLLHVPLVLRYPPAIPPGVRVTPTVSLRDVPATILDLTRAQGSGPGELPGYSLAPLWHGASSPWSPAAAALSYDDIRPADAPIRWHYVSLVTDSLQYISDDGDRHLLFSLQADPAQEVNLAVEGDGVLIARRLAEQARAVLFRAKP
ncbi:MAG TPA: sulfatase [Gemmatimonadaceae bacterium]